MPSQYSLCLNCCKSLPFIANQVRDGELVYFYSLSLCTAFPGRCVDEESGGSRSCSRELLTYIFPWCAYAINDPVASSALVCLLPSPYVFFYSLIPFSKINVLSNMPKHAIDCQNCDMASKSGKKKIFCAPTRQGTISRSWICKNNVVLYSQMPL